MFEFSLFFLCSFLLLLLYFSKTLCNCNLFCKVLQSLLLFKMNVTTRWKQNNKSPNIQHQSVWFWTNNTRCWEQSNKSWQSCIFSPFFFPRLGLDATCRGGAGNPNIRSSIQPELSCLAASDCWSGCQVMSALVLKQGKSFACSDFSVPTRLNPQLLSQDFGLF